MREVTSCGLHLLLDEYAENRPHEIAYRFLRDGESDEVLISYSALAERARAMAGGLSRVARPGEPVLVIQPPGLDFIASLFACWHVGVIAIPAYPPRGTRHRQRLQAVLADSGAALAIGPADDESIPGLKVLGHEGLEQQAIHGKFLPADEKTPCLLQYTSGSTAAPKGVMISHANLRAHFAALSDYQNKLGLSSAVSWLPPYHDMGLVLKILFPLEAGIPLTFFSPDHFIQRPVRWLRAISNYRGEFSGGPNFAFEMCLRGIRDEELKGLDLSCWKSAPCGAERIRVETLEKFAARFEPYGFRKENFMPGYGMAETTLIATAHPVRGEPVISEHPVHGRLVSCGKELKDVRCRITDPESGAECAEGVEGEVCIQGPIVASGYWHRAQETASAFGPEGLHTGDLGYLENGHLFITGRLKDLIILNGQNIAPDDIEQVVMEKLPIVVAAAAFAMEHHRQEGIGLVLEIPGKIGIPAATICQETRMAVGEGMEAPLHRIFLTRQGLLPRTTSGKIQRQAVAAAIKSGSLKLLYAEEPMTPQTTAGQLEEILTLAGEVTGKSGITASDDVVSVGMSSMEVTRLAARYLAWSGVSLSHAEIFAARSFEELAALGTSRDVVFPAISRENSSPTVLTHSQERMWFLHQMEPESSAYHVFGAVELCGKLDTEALQRAYGMVISRHSILSSRHADDQGKVRSWIDGNAPPSLENHHTDSRDDAQQILTIFAQRPFRLECDSPVRACLIRWDEDRHALAICAHHIVADGWSIRILTRELTACYAAYAIGQPSPAFPSAPDYQSYAAWHRQWAGGSAVERQIQYWKEQLAGHSGIMNLATDFPRPLRTSSHGAAIAQTLDATLANGISCLAAAHRATSFMVQLAAFHLLLRHHGGGDDQVVAVPVANRNHAATENLIGTLVNTLPFRMELAADESFSQLLERVRTASFEMQAMQDAPFERIIEEVKPGRSHDHSPLAQVMIDHQELPLVEQWTHDLHCTPLLAHRGAAQFDLSLLLFVLRDRQQVVLEYRSDLFLPETAQAMLERYVKILESVTRDPSQKVREIQALTEGDRVLLEKISHGPDRPAFPSQTLPLLIGKRCALHPDRKAITASGKSITYRELDTLSSRLAEGLRRQDVSAGDRVAILLERTISLIPIMLAIWKAGAAYVPLDPENPPERMAVILEDQSPIRVLASPPLLAKLPKGHPTLLLNDELECEAGADHAPTPSEVAYVIYTSGSTGKPKGVSIRHGALANFLLSMAEKPGFTEADKLLAVTTVSFDISTLELFLPLALGGSVEIATREVARDGGNLLATLQQSKATVMQATPATWRLLLDAGWKGSRYLKILCGGEAMDLDLAQHLRPLCGQLWNMYGPTETTVWSTLWQVPQNPQAIRIGQPIANTGCLVLAQDGSMAPPGITGELAISGAGLATGYWQQDELTKARFIPVHTGNGTTRRAYLTGDLARWHADGTLECLGRNDDQVKIRGFRVELGEIEAALTTHPEILQAKVALRNQRLMAWVMPARGTMPDLMELRSFLGARLPSYMLPAFIGPIDQFPLNTNGKVDLSRLPDPATTPLPAAESPATATEIALAALWCELLECPVVYREDDWFHIGGHSLLALRLFARIHGEFQRALPLSSIMDHPTLRKLAQLIDMTPISGK